MILFHVEALDLDKPEVRSRAWLTACILRRAGLAARLVTGDVGTDLLSTARCLILTGGASHHALSTARRTAGKLPIILDIGSVERLNEFMGSAHREEFRELAALASSITTSNEVLARDIEHFVGAAPVMVAPDPIDIEDNLAAALRLHPGAALRMLAERGDRWLRDAVARLRGKWPSHATSQQTSKRIVWFGGSAQPNGEGGLAELLLAASDLVDLAEQYPLRLDVVGQSPRAARRLLKQLAIPIAFHRYSPQRVRQALRRADLCLLPGGGDRESLARSTARARLASALGVPVVTGAIDKPMLPAMRAALEATAAKRARPDRSALLAIQEQEADSIETAWQRVIDVSHASAGQRSPDRVSGHLGRKLQVLFLLQQVQDIDLIVPVAEAASADPVMEVRVAVLSKIAVPASRRFRAICANGAKMEFWQGSDLLGRRIASARFAADVGVTASEGLGFGARYAKAFVAASQRAGTRILSLQHGLDNGGLTYGPQPSSNVFRGDLVLTWGGLDRLTNAAREEVRKKTVPVGCPKRVFGRSDFPDFPLTDRPFIAVFENLHWQRYNDDYRKRFVSDLAATAESLPEQAFLVKPHMGGQWFVRGGAAGKPLPANIVIANPGAVQWRRFTADAFLAYASAVITTPSTIALDAARYGVPVAVVTYGIAARNYHPLPRLERTADWSSFVDVIRDGRYDRKKLEAFFADAALPGDAVARILAVIRMAGAKRTYAEIMAALDGTRRDLAAS